MPASSRTAIITTLLLAAFAGAAPGEVQAQTGTAQSADGAPLPARPPEAGTAAQSETDTPDDGEALTITWDDLLPDGEMDRIQELYNAASTLGGMDHFGGQMPQIGTFNVEESLVGQIVRMPGYILPLDYQPGGMIEEFLLVPYVGACIHTPPPPPNQIVYVTVAEPIRVERLWSAVWVTGRLTADRHMNSLGDAAYTLELTGHEPYRRQ